MPGRYGLNRVVMRWPARVAVHGPEVGHGSTHHHVIGFWGGGVVMWIVFLVIIGVLVYFLTQSLGSKPTREPPNDTALEILEKRYARGEITKDELEEMRRSL
jgi:putative membrane protein